MDRMMMAESRHIMIPWSAWVEDTQFELALADTLRTELLAPADIAAWDRKQIHRAIANPIGSPPIRELARHSQTAKFCKPNAAPLLTTWSRIAKVRYQSKKVNDAL